MTVQVSFSLSTAYDRRRAASVFDTMMLKREGSRKKQTKKLESSATERIVPQRLSMLPDLMDARSCAERHVDVRCRRDGVAVSKCAKRVEKLVVQQQNKV